jgi:hypothetical protein
MHKCPAASILTNKGGPDMDNIAPEIKIVKLPLDRMNGGVSSDQENSTEDSSRRTIEASTFDTLENGGANTVSRNGVGSFVHISSWSNTAFLSPGESMFLSLIFSDGIEVVCSVFQDATGWWAIHRM